MISSLEAVDQCVITTIKKYELYNIIRLENVLLFTRFRTPLHQKYIATREMNISPFFRC